MQSPFGAFDTMFKATVKNVNRKETKSLAFDEEFVAKMEPRPIE